MAVKIAIANQKGGVGKTTTAINIADALKHIGYKVLFIDVDPQHNSTSTYDADILDVSTIVDVFKKDCTAEEAIQHMPIGDIIAGDDLLAQEESNFMHRPSAYTMLKKALEPLESKYDFIIVDTPPNLGTYMYNALIASDGCVIPIDAENYAIKGLGLLIKTIHEVQEENPNLKIYGVLMTRYDARNALDKNTFDILPQIGEAKGFKTFKTPIRISQDIKKVQNMPDENNKHVNRSLYENYGTCAAAVDYVNLVKELLEVIKNG